MKITTILAGISTASFSVAIGIQIGGYMQRDIDLHSSFSQLVPAGEQTNQWVITIITNVDQFNSFGPLPTNVFLPGGTFNADDSSTITNFPYLGTH